MTTQLAQAIGTSRKTLYKHRKFRMQIDENDELACWAIICRQSYKDRWEKVLKILYKNIGWNMLEFHQIQGM